MRTAYLLTGEHHAAEDLVQVSLARVFLAWHRIRDKGVLDGYVRRTMLNEHLGWWRRTWRRVEYSTDAVPDRPAPAPIEGPFDEELWTHICALPARQRAVIVLRYYEDLSESEIANLLGCAPGTVKSAAYRALATLRSRVSNVSTTPERASEESR